MAENKSQVVIDVESIPSRPLWLDNSDTYIASDSSDLSLAEGKKLLTKRAAKEYIDNYLQIDNNKYSQFVSTPSNIIDSRQEFDEDDYPVSDKPCFMKYIDNLIIDISQYGLTIDKQGVYQTIRGRDIIVDNSDIEKIINTFSSEYDGCYVSDSSCDGSDNSKYLTSIMFTDETNGMFNINYAYRYFRTENGEIINAFIDNNNKKLMDINRNASMGLDYNNLDLYPINDGEFIHLLNAIHVFFDVSTNIVVFIKDTSIEYGTILPEMPQVNDCFYDTISNTWNICTILGVWQQYNNYVYLGDLIYDSSTLIGIKCSDSHLLLNNVNNIDLRIKGETAYTFSDKTVITVYNKLVEFDVDRIYWDLSGLSGIQYLYLDGEGKPWIDTLQPKWINDIQYYGHYKHYWRCIGKVEKIDDSWVIKEKY